MNALGLDAKYLFPERLPAFRFALSALALWQEVASGTSIWATQIKNSGDGLESYVPLTQQAAGETRSCSRPPVKAQ